MPYVLYVYLRLYFIVVVKFQLTVGELESLPITERKEIYVVL